VYTSYVYDIFKKEPDYRSIFSLIGKSASSCRLIEEKSGNETRYSENNQLNQYKFNALEWETPQSSKPYCIAQQHFNVQTSFQAEGKPNSSILTNKISRVRCQ
jgi:hypothetical protein